jgi:chorismate mutase-like protein
MVVSLRRPVVLGSVTAIALAFGVACLADATPAPVPATQSSGANARRSSDACRRLTDLAVQRLLLSDQVAASKFGTDQPIDDPVREQEELDQVRKRSISAGSDPEASVRFFGDQINASKIVQEGLFKRWTTHPAEAPTTRPDLSRIRTQLDQLTTEILQELKGTRVVRRPTRASTQPVEAQVSGEILDHLDALHRHALDVAVQSVCCPA